MKAEVNGRPETGQIWATGSQKFALMKGISESLAGRLIPLEFMPLSIYEQTGHSLGQTPYLPSPVLVSKLRIRTQTKPGASFVCCAVYQKAPNLPHAF